MILFDITSLPKGVDINVWYSLYEKGLCIYQSSDGIGPVKVDDSILALIDVNNMTTNDKIELNRVVNEINEDNHKKNEQENKIISENNRNLVKYLRSINKENI
jgi:hypothetical protein